MQAPLPRFRPGKMQLRSIFAFASWIALGFLMKRLDDFVVERMKFWKVVNLDEEVNNNILLLLAVFAHVFVALFIRYLAAAMAPPKSQSQLSNSKYAIVLFSCSVVMVTCLSYYLLDSNQFTLALVSLIASILLFFKLMELIDEMRSFLIPYASRLRSALRVGCVCIFFALLFRSYLKCSYFMSHGYVAKGLGYLPVDGALLALQSLTITGYFCQISFEKMMSLFPVWSPAYARHSKFGIRACSGLSLVCWTGLGLLADRTDGMRHLRSELTIVVDGWMGKDTQLTCAMVLLALIFLAQYCRIALKHWQSSKIVKPLRATMDPGTEMIIVVIVALIVIVCLLARHFASPSNSSVYDPILFMLVGALFLAISELIDSIKAVLFPFFWILRISVAIVAGILVILVLNIWTSQEFGRFTFPIFFLCQNLFFYLNFELRNTPYAESEHIAQADKD